MRRHLFITLCVSALICLSAVAEAKLSGRRSILFMGASQQPADLVSPNFVGTDFGWHSMKAPLFHLSGWRTLGTIGFVDPNYVGIMRFDQVYAVEGAPNWTGFDQAVSNFVSISGADKFVLSHSGAPAWASIGNSDSRTVTVTGGGTTSTVEVGGSHNFFGSAHRVVLTGSGTLPVGLSKNTEYCIREGNYFTKLYPSATSFTLGDCTAANNPVASTGVSTGTITVSQVNSNPANWSDLDTWLTNARSHMISGGAPARFVVEGPNEPFGNQSGHYEGDANALLDYMDHLWSWAKAQNPPVEVWSPPINDLGNQAYKWPWEQATPGREYKFDVYAVHNYASSGYNFKTDILDNLDAHIAYLATKGYGNKPIVISEMSLYPDGGGLVDDVQTPKFMSASMIAAALRKVREVYPYIYSRNGEWGWCTNCIVGDGPAPGLTNVGLAVQVTRGWLVGSHSFALISSGASMQIAFKTSFGINRLAVWKNQSDAWGAGQTTTSVTVPSWASSCEDYLGASVACTAGGTINVTSGPVLIKGN